eukprot:CAMPEP_0171198410 /NCGR_PEP_ID=MMETSP0790-20130122/22925_1 /TAXON_ID=2925 /ORGANISM="Alexandrium catenella, Strain OF101" /LENGTH=113 /DNA_ID=CAMNT_0011663707 /DNA_START=60 /DNA_END=398 /DNA_ORIENTATION=+
MALRSRSCIAPLAAGLGLLALALWASAPAAFVAPRSSSGPSALAAIGAVVLPAAAQAAPATGIDVPTEVLDAGSSVSLAAFTEILMVGIVMGTVPITVLGLLVAAWLQFKKGP